MLAVRCCGPTHASEPFVGMWAVVDFDVVGESSKIRKTITPATWELEQGGHHVARRTAVPLKLVACSTYTAGRTWLGVMTDWLMLIQPV